MFCEPQYMYVSKMCGIICILSYTPNNDINLLNEFNIFKENICKRGPDSINVEIYSLENYNLLIAASILWLQGKVITKQPVLDRKSIFAYNGDIFGGIPDNLREESGDTSVFFERIKNTQNISTVLSSLNGPYAFIYFDEVRQQLYFGRDIFGRRSLLIGKRSGVLVLTSVAKRTSEYDFLEVPSIGTFCLDLNSNQLYIIPWQYKNKNFDEKLDELKLFIKTTIFVKPELSNKENKKFLHPNVKQLDLLNKIRSVPIETAFEILLNDSDWFKRVFMLNTLLEEAIRKRISSQPNYCKFCVTNKSPCNHSLIGILFSGGVDCAVLAVLASKIVPSNRPIDLINVAFDEVNKYLTPDRITGIQTLEELKKIDPERKWNFLNINVTQKELDNARKQHIADLIYPLQSILDDSLGCALWFASRAIETSEQGDITSPSRVLLVGMGADELFGGYTRHRAALKRHSWQGLHNMLDEDWQNLSHRNLGRDDRVVSDHGRQLRTPYLDENVVNFVRDLNCWEKTFPSDQVIQGVGEKILLRCLAYHIGLRSAASLKKRALQFGSRIANKKENAHEISKRLCDM